MQICRLHIAASRRLVCIAYMYIYIICALWMVFGSFEHENRENDEHDSDFASKRDEVR